MTGLDQILYQGAMQLESRLHTVVNHQWAQLGSAGIGRVRADIADLLWVEQQTIIGAHTGEVDRVERLARADLQRLASTSVTVGAILWRELWRGVLDIGRQVVDTLLRAGASALARIATTELERLSSG